MRNTLIPARYFLVFAIALAGLQTAAQAELNLTIPKPPPTANTPQEAPANRLDIPDNPPAGYQTTDRCPSGSQVTDMQRTNGKVYYKCSRSGTNFPPAVRDAERYERRPAHCMPGSIEAQCR